MKIFLVGIFVCVGNEAYHTRTVTHYKSYGMHVKYVKSLLENESLNCLKSFVWGQSRSRRQTVLK